MNCHTHTHTHEITSAECEALDRLSYQEILDALDAPGTATQSDSCAVGTELDDCNTPYPRRIVTPVYDSRSGDLDINWDWELFNC